MKTPFDVSLGGSPVYHCKEIARARMKNRATKSVTWTLKDLTVSWQYIPATAAKNWDGSPAGHGNDPSQEILQKMTWRSGSAPRFTNYW